MNLRRVALGGAATLAALTWGVAPAVAAPSTDDGCSFAQGTKMTFAGLSNPEDRANVIAFLNAHSNAPLPLPAAPAEAAPAAGDKAAAEADGAGAEKAENEPVLNEQQAGRAHRVNQLGRRDQS